MSSQPKSWQDALKSLQETVSRTRQGGGPKAVERQHQKNRLTARERIAHLIDEGSEFDELMTLAGFEMYQDVGGCPSGGTVAGIGYLHGRPWMIIANDATVKAGAFFPITAKKVIRAQTMALENHIPVVYLVDSAGVYLPMQDEIFPDQDDFGRVFYLNARMSALGIPQIAAIMGNCVAGGAYLPVMCDTLIMTEGSGLYLAGPALVKAAIGQNIESEALGGASVHAEISGTVDYKEKDDLSAIRRIRALAEMQTQKYTAPWAQKRKTPRAPQSQKDLLDTVSLDGSKPYDVREVLKALLDDSHFEEYKPEYGQSIVCALGWLGGYPVGVVANDRQVIRKKLKSDVPGLQTRIEVGGVIYGDSADKSARFIMEVNQMGIPLIFVSDVTGFMVGKDSEYEGIIRKGAKMVNAVSNTVVPKITLITGGSYGAGNYAMNGKAYGPRFLYAWPSARYAVMSGNAAAKTLLDIQLQALKRQGQEPTDEDLQTLFEQVKDKYDQELDPRYAAARLWVDEIILPESTRERLIRTLEACSGSPTGDFRTGMLQV
ncbi:acyl-CoA carboxylase subunit beta [Deinococcus roseus]|uniref:Propionyl-CoA carboxylase subunit beta n=1 Tax=Deinococcus roseus TaxID=392414 RepID=A0ABQ2CVF4_9DEIO|nr:acyl-CoA carboxylase subunit beta [Deinococcus roseus]GGJ24635.1 propionyl-CoA carboxylase subunit beta [Deinococcus roseus]